MLDLTLESFVTELDMYVFVFKSQNELRPAYEDFLLKKQEKAAKNKKKEEVNCYYNIQKCMLTIKHTSMISPCLQDLNNFGLFQTWKSQFPISWE